MKVKSILALSLIIVLALCCFTGCGKEVIVKPIQSASQGSGQSAEQNTETASFPSTLSEIDVSDFENALNDESNYGFLLSDYDDVRDADMYQIFYIGAGLPAPANSDAIRAADEATFTDGTPDCDSTILTAQQVSDFLLLKTGYSLADMSSYLSWDYVADYDAYVHWHGDTNFISINCTGGRKISADTYEIEYALDGGFYDDDSNLLTGGMVTVRISDNTLQFISNSMY
ncbi:MAG: hypothetical protein CVU91_08890 [Firmicutes bacterium HGW-Firmicutes-16]|nr:MAG: hypothetical protein CVU91_08890 [Firmicutes bacterium HGW-Firmicutes-16]